MEAIATFKINTESFHTDQTSLMCVQVLRADPGYRKGSFSCCFCFGMTCCATWKTLRCFLGLIWTGLSTRIFAVGPVIETRGPARQRSSALTECSTSFSMLAGRAYKGEDVGRSLHHQTLLPHQTHRSEHDNLQNQTLLLMSDNMVILNNHKMLGHDVQFFESTGSNHTEANRNFCCVVMVNGKVEGRASGWPNKRKAKAAAAADAVESLGLA